MEVEEVTELLISLRRMGGEPSTVEVKSGAGGFPRSVRESLVAFANTGGGTVVIGLDEASGFRLIDLPDPAAYRDSIVALSRDAITPALHIHTDIVDVEGHRILVAEVPPATADLRPVYVTSKGVSNGAYLRTGDGDRRMTEGEIALVYSSRTQPLHDREPVNDASFGDLGRSAVARTLDRVRIGSASLRDVDDPVALHRLGVLAGPSKSSPPTLAGLLTFGEFPQQYFPQLMVSVVVHPNDPLDQARFLDSVTVRGSIPVMVAETLSAIRRNLAARAVITEGGRSDHLDYPLEAIREGVVNALMHRDYSAVTRGTQVQIELFGDRLVIRSPGGLYGGLTEDDLGQIGISSSRNSVLANLLSDTYLPRSDQLLAENRASGVPTMISNARRNGLPRPVFESSVATFTVTMGRSELLGPETRQWLASLQIPALTPMHQIALAMMRNGYASNAALREWGSDRMTAGQVLRDLVDAGLAVRQGGRRYARYRLDPVASQAPLIGSRVGSSAKRLEVDAVLRQAGAATAAQLQGITGLGRVAVLNRLNELIATGAVRAVGAARSPKRKYEWVGEGARTTQS